MSTPVICSTFGCGARVKNISNCIDKNPICSICRSKLSEMIIEEAIMNLDGLQFSSALGGCVDHGHRTSRHVEVNGVMTFGD